MDLLCTCRVDPVHQSPRTRMYGYLTHGPDPPPRPCSSGFLSPPNRLRQLPSPAHFRRRLPGHAAFAALVVLHSRPSTGRASLATSLSLIGLLTPVPPGDSASPPEVTRCSFHTVPSANTLVRWVNEYAFAFIVQARPCPTFGRPVHLRGGPHRLQPGTSPHALRIPPRGEHPALREPQAVAPGPPWLCPAFAFVPV